jgi:NADH dehydrogenase
MIRIPVPGSLASLGARLGEAAGLDMPINEGQITMLEEGNVIERPEDNALESVFHVHPTGIAEGLAKLADSLPEQLPDDGVGGLKHRHVWADVVGATCSAETLFERFRRRFSDVTPWQMDVGSEPGTPTEPQEGATLTMRLPLRGNIQVRIQEITPRRLTLVTLEGHPLAGAVHFACDDRAGGRLRFEVKVYDRSSNVFDWLVMSTVGGHVQRATWKSIVEAVVEESGGAAPDGVQHESRTLHGSDAAEVEAWLRDLVTTRKREEHAGRSPSGDAASDRPVPR